MDAYLLDDLARAVADDSYLTHPRRWLCRHRLPLHATVGLPAHEHGQLIKDYKEMALAAKLLSERPKVINNYYPSIEYGLSHGATV